MEARGWRHTVLLLTMAQTITGQLLAQGYSGGIGQTLFLSGQVVLEDGSPPPERVVVQRICETGQPIPQGHTDSKGRFSFAMGQETTSLLFDAQNVDHFRSGPPPNQVSPGAPSLAGCELRVQLPGFYPAIRDLGGRRTLDSPDVGTLVLRRIPGVVGSTFSETAFTAQKEARTAYEKGRTLAQERKLDEARKEYEKAVQIAPRFASAWFELGLVHQMQNHPADARKAYGESLLADPRFVKPYRQMAVLAFDEQKWEEVVNTTDRLFGLDPVSYPDAYFLSAFANFYLNRLDAAERSSREVVKLDSDRSIPRARYVLGAVLIEKHDYAGAAEQLREYVDIAEPGPDVARAKEMLAQLEARLGAGSRSAP
jgi:tetratricopeptide (TPR) repeat protein